MSEKGSAMSDKPVYQSLFIETEFHDGWRTIDKQTFEDRSKLVDRYQVRILYPASAYEALKAENIAQAKRIAELEDRISSFPIPTSVALQKIGKLRQEGFKEYAATVLNKENQYCIVGDYGDVRWASKNGDSK